MAKIATPAYTQSALIGNNQMTAANTARDGTGTLYSIVTGGTNDSLLDYLVFKATGTTAAGTLRIFIYDGTHTRLLDEITTAGVTPSGTLPSEEFVWTPPGGVPLFLPATYQIYACTNNAETWNVFAFGGNY